MDAEGVTEVDPSACCDPRAGVKFTFVAFFDVQSRVTACPAVTVAGMAVSEQVGGPGVGGCAVTSGAAVGTAAAGVLLWHALATTRQPDKMHNSINLILLSMLN